MSTASSMSGNAVVIRGVRIVALAMVLTIGVMSFGSGSALADDTPDGCRAGYVWREAIWWDHVCVTPQTRDQTWQDNALDPQRKLANGYCVSGYVWREAYGDDRVCVTPQTRDQARQDNAAASMRQVGTPPCAESSTPGPFGLPQQVVRCSPNQFWRVTFTAFTHNYIVYKDAGSSMVIEHWEGSWVQRPGRFLTATNTYAAATAGTTGNSDCPSYGSMGGTCYLPPPQRTCSNWSQGTLDCRDGGGGAFSAPVNIGSVRASGWVTFGNGEGLALPTVANTL